MSWLSPPIVHREKPKSAHPWCKTINNIYSRSYKYAHNSTNNPVYPKIKEKVPYAYRLRFTVVGNMMTKEFIYCSRLVEGLHRYKWKTFEAPIIKGEIPKDWPQIFRQYMGTYGSLKLSTSRNCVVLLNDKFIGGMDDLKNLIEDRYIYHLALEYQKESIFQFANYVKASGLYNDICPVTCDNFLRLCKSKKGGYSGTPVHRIVKDGWIQCGGFGLKEVPMSCENFIVDHDQRGIIGMTNSGRHVECSTQFYVLLQPLPWMRYRYVAFGKLIEGAETLNKIEEVRTLNESPLSNIIIYKSGILNLDCQDIMINKHANEYIDGHIDDLVEIGDFFIEMLLEKVFLDEAVKALDGLLAPESNFKSEEEEEEEEEEESEDSVSRQKSSLHDSLRFLHKNNNQYVNNVTENEQQKNDDTDKSHISIYEEKDEKTIVNVPINSKIWKKKPFYIPLTDVPYPGEKDSHFDLKRMLQGDYCLESDLDPNIMKKKKKTEEILERTSLMMKSYSRIQTVTEEVVFLTDSEEEIVQEYLSQYREIASFGAETVRKIANQFLTDNPLAQTDERTIYTDEDLRKIRLARKDVLGRESRKGSVTVNEAPWEVHMQVKRRQTGFIRQVDLLKIHLPEEDNEGKIIAKGEEDEVSYETDSKDDMLWMHASSIRFKEHTDEERRVKTQQKQTDGVPPNIPKNLEMIDEKPEQDDDITDESSSFSLPSVVPSGVAFHPSRLNLDYEEEDEPPKHTERKRRPTEFEWDIPQVDKGGEAGDVKEDHDDKTNGQKADDSTDSKKAEEKAENENKPNDEPSVKVNIDDDKKSKRKSDTIIAKSDKDDEANLDSVDVNNNKENEDKPEKVDFKINQNYEGKADKVEIIDKKNEEKVDKVDVNNKNNELKAASSDAAQLHSGSNTSKRASLLERLYEDVALNDTYPGGPTLKNYTPMSKLKKNILLLKSTRLSDVAEDNIVDHSRKVLEKGDSAEKFLAHYGSNVKSKLSSEYIMAISKAERLPGESLRTLEYHDQRPSLSVTEYKNKYRADKRKLEEQSKSTSKHILIPDSSSATISE